MDGSDKHVKVFKGQGKATRSQPIQRTVGSRESGSERGGPSRGRAYHVLSRVKQSALKYTCTQLVIFRRIYAMCVCVCACTTNTVQRAHKVDGQWGGLCRKFGGKNCTYGKGRRSIPSYMAALDIDFF